MLDQDVDHQDSGRPFAFPAPQRREQHDVGFHVPIVALDERRLDQLQPSEIDLLDDVGAAQRQQIADVPGVLQEELDGVFPELPHNLQNPCLDHTLSFSFPRYRPLGASAVAFAPAHGRSSSIMADGRLQGQILAFT